MTGQRLATTNWHPFETTSRYQPPTAGDLIAREHAVWRVTKVADLPLSDNDRELWLEAGMPDPATWRDRPYRVHVEWVAGARPSWAPTDGPVQSASVSVPATRYSGHSWNIYPASGRWPCCSCCGEPMPCRTELQDQEVARGLADVEKMATRLPGCCWACGEPITSRQKAVTYPGDNLDLPGGIEVRFHTRSACRYSAKKYELRWISVDPRRERILTWPKCGGNLIVHADGSSECQSGPGPFGDERQGEHDCQGHLTHDHSAHAACYVGDAWFAHPSQMPGCPRGCKPEGHPGARTTPRPERRPHDPAASRG
jgi:hypothetical protein